MQEPLNASYPVLPLRDIVVFPHMIVPLFVGREKSVKALEEVMSDDKQILLSSQSDPSEDDPESDGIFKAGVLANVLQLLKLPDGTVKVLVEGVARVRITEFLENDVFFEARAQYLTEMPGDMATTEALLPDLVSVFMTEMQAKGISFALDDFGSGYIAFRYFKDFTFDIVKIDGSFIQGITRNPDNQVLTQALVSIAQQFDMYTVAEFVESKEDADYLASIGIDCLQGYYFGAARIDPEWKSNKGQKIAS